MFEDLLIHPRSLGQLEQFIANPKHGLILTGTEGAGKRRLALAVAAQLLGLSAEKLEKYPYFSLTDPADPTITIDEIRGLQKLLQLKTPGEAGRIRRVFIVADAGRMRQEAQNAFLKSLEEPPADTCIILTTEANGDLLPTIYSRAQRVDVLPVSESGAREYFSKKGATSADITRNYALSQGQAGLLSSLLAAETEHELKTWVNTGKELLGKAPGERLLQTDELSKDKPGTLLLINVLGRITHAALMGAAKTGNTKAIKKWQQSMQAVQEARDALQHNANTKLVLDNLLLSL